MLNNQPTPNSKVPKVKNHSPNKQTNISFHLLILLFPYYTFCSRQPAGAQKVFYLPMNHWVIRMKKHSETLDNVRYYCQFKSGSRPRAKYHLKHRLTVYQPCVGKQHNMKGTLHRTNKELPLITGVRRSMH